MDNVRSTEPNSNKSPRILFEIILEFFDGFISNLCQGPGWDILLITMLVLQSQGTTCWAHNLSDWFGVNNMISLLHHY